MAAALFAAMGCDGFVVQSAGLAAWPGSAASEHAITVTGIHDHTSQQATAELLEQADVIICLARGHALQIAPFVPHEKIRVLGGGVADPFGGSLGDYRAYAAQIQAALPSLLPDIRCTANIIPANPSHIPTIAQLEQVVFSHAASELKLHEKLALDTCHMLTALLDDEIVGFVIVDEIAGEAFIDDLAVFPAFWHQGVASKLLARAELAAILRGCTKMHLEVRESNTPARKLYEQRGYTQVGRRKNYYQNPRKDAILYTLEFR